ncbi:hypothetical protein CEXT_338471 [Caerostris extrusa]|uniref:Uncharacterized protein n=1 Tax=Caerostris extrusa TaxID=172846 RepID=A0AAV4VG84_CAEEX|nr:hypothetical protein CEXT_338471 [Caerostris extrusa]
MVEIGVSTITLNLTSSKCVTAIKLTVTFIETPKYRCITIEGKQQMEQNLSTHPQPIACLPFRIIDFQRSPPSQHNGPHNGDDATLKNDENKKEFVNHDDNNNNNNNNNNMAAGLFLYGIMSKK